MKAARIAAGVAWRTEDTHVYEQSIRDHALEVARTQASSLAPASSGQILAPPHADVLIPPGARIAKCSDYADPLRREVVKVFDNEKLEQCRAQYVKLEHDDPDPGQEPSAEQLSVLWHLLLSGFAPFVDFAIWGPHNERFQRRMQFVGLRPGPDGTLHKLELHGPSNIDMWVEAFNVLAVALIMLMAVLPPVVCRYRDFVVKMVRTHGAHCWAIIYQAEVRMRREVFDRIKRRLAQLHASGVMIAHPSCSVAYDPEKPWNAVFAHAIHDEFWQTEVFTPCIQVGARIKSPAQFLQGDATIMASSSGANPVDVKQLLQPSSRAPRPNRRSGGKGQSKGAVSSQRSLLLQKSNPLMPGKTIPYATIGTGASASPTRTVLAHPTRLAVTCVGGATGRITSRPNVPRVKTEARRRVPRRRGSDRTVTPLTPSPMLMLPPAHRTTSLIVHRALA